MFCCVLIGDSKKKLNNFSKFGFRFCIVLFFSTLTELDIGQKANLEFNLFSLTQLLVMIGFSAFTAPLLARPPLISSTVYLSMLLTN